MAAAFLPPATSLFRGSRVAGAVEALCPTGLRASRPPPLSAFPRRTAAGNGDVIAAAAVARRSPLRASVAAPPPPAPLLPVPAAATHRATRGLRGVRPIHTALITGASGGIGAETVAALGQLYPDLRCLVVAVRDTDKARSRLLGPDGELAANPRLAAATVLVQVELESVASAVSAAEEAVAVLDRVAGCGLDLFVANAGVMACPQAVTEDGFEKQMGTYEGGGRGSLGPEGRGRGLRGRSGEGSAASLACAKCGWSARGVGGCGVALRALCGVDGGRQAVGCSVNDDLFPHPRYGLRRLADANLLASRCSSPVCVACACRPAPPPPVPP